MNRGATIGYRSATQYACGSPFVLILPPSDDFARLPAASTRITAEREGTMGYFEGKKGLILGVANDRSIAWAIAKEIMDQGGTCGFTHLPDKPDDEKKKNRRRVSQLTDLYPKQAPFLEPMDVNKDDNIAAIMERARSEFGQIDFLLHSLAFATLEDLKRDTIETSRDGFKLAMEISAYSLIAVSRAARPILAPGASILTMTYFGGERCVPGYNVMGICKAALEASMRYLAYDLGPSGVRVLHRPARLSTLNSSALSTSLALEGGTIGGRWRFFGSSVRSSSQVVQKSCNLGRADFVVQ